MSTPKYRLVIAKDGYDARSEPTAHNKVFDSKYESLKYFSFNTTTLVVSGSTTEKTIAHNLGYVPMFFVYADKVSPQLGPTTYTFSMLPLRIKSFTFYTYLEAYADTTNLYIKCKTNSATVTFNLYYKICSNDTGL